MTDDDKALVERLRGDWPEILVEKHWMMDSDAIDKQREEAAHRIEALSAENERLREALKPFAKAGEIAGEPSPYGDWYAFRPAAGDEYAIFGQHLRDARAALGDTK